MRFAYIDSQGNEVPIPSVDALALRIELGAIGPETQLYDAQADHWGPANTHEIFHTLSRQKGGEGFVAPPPVAPPPPGLGQEPASAGVEADTSAEVASDAAPEEEPEDVPSFDLADGLVAADDEPPVEVVASDDLGLGDLDLSLAGSPVAEVEPPAEEPADDMMDLGMAFGGPEVETGEEAADEDEAEEGGFDFGDMGSLELETPHVEEAETPMGFGGGMELESPLGGDDAMDFAGLGDDGDAGLDLETPMSEFSAEEPPSWMEQSEPDSDEAEGSMDFSRPSGGDEEAPAEDSPRAGRKEPPQKERREPVSRPSPPRRRKSKMPLILGVVAVAVVGGGGYFGWQFMSSRPDRPDTEEETPALPAVIIPDIPAELLPIMRDLAEAALGDMVAELQGMQAALDLPQEPRNDWLSGSYLGQASQYEDLEQYWLGIEAFVDRVREIDTQLFHDMYVVRVEAAGIAADTAAILIERADSGFLATREERFVAYNEMDDLINAALNLHDFLLNNEQDIAYEPAAGGVSRDPVLEAVPATDALGREMWEMVDQITEALDALGTLDRVTTPRLFAVLFDRIRRAGIE